MLIRLQRTATRVFTIPVAVALSIALVAPVLLVSTFASSTEAAVIYGYPVHLGWTLPVSLDCVALIGTLVASRARDKGLRRYAVTLVYLPLALSWAANALGHITRSPGTVTHAVIAGVLAGGPPVALVAVLHLAMKLRNGAPKSVTQPTDQTVTPVTLPVTSQLSPVTSLSLVPSLDPAAMTVGEIRELARNVGVSIRGSKDEIASRIRKQIEVA